jgi:hypothetical protein
MIMCLKPEDGNDRVFTDQDFANNYRISLTEEESSFKSRYIQILPEDWKRGVRPGVVDDLGLYKNCWTKNVRGIESIFMSPREIVRLNGKKFDNQMALSFRIASEPTYDDFDSTILLMVLILGFYFLFLPLYKFVFMRFITCCKKEKKKISKEQVWGKKGCCFGLCCGKKDFGSIS